MDFRIIRCKGCGKRLTPWTLMCRNCRRMLPTVLLLGVAVVVIGILLTLLFLQWRFDIKLI